MEVETYKQAMVTLQEMAVFNTLYGLEVAQSIYKIKKIEISDRTTSKFIEKH